MFVCAIYSKSLKHYSRYSVHPSMEDMISSVRDYITSGRDPGLLYGIKSGDFDLVFTALDFNDKLEYRSNDLRDIPLVSEFIDSIYGGAKNA